MWHLIFSFFLLSLQTHRLVEAVSARGRGVEQVDL